MITKIQPPHPYLAVTLRYNFRKVEKGEASVLYTRGLKFKKTEDVFFEITKQRFYDTLPEHYRTVNIVFHASINPHKDDNLDDQTIEYFIDDRRFKLLVQFTYYFPTRQPLGFCTGVFFLVLS